MSEQSGAGRPLPAHLDPRQGRPQRPARTAGESPAGSRRTVRTRRHPVLRALSWLAVLSSIAVVATAGAGYALVNRYDSNLTTLPIFNRNDTQGRPPPAPRDAKNVLLVGSDSRGALKAGEGTQGVGDSFVTGQRSDVVILAHLYGDSDQADLISFPRDSYVTIPAYTDAKGIPHDEHMDKLNAALYDGGPQLLIRTIENLTGQRLRIDNYVQIDFDGFKNLVDTLGGVEVCLSEPAKEKLSGIDLPAGRQTVQGDQALAFVRQRKKLAGGDLARIQRQQQLVGAIARKVLSAGTLLNPLKVNDVVGTVTQNLTIDDTLTKKEQVALAFRFRSFAAGGISFETVPVADAGAKRKTPIGRSDVVLLDEQKMDALFRRLQNDEPVGAAAPPPAASPAPVLTVPANRIRVRVYNGVGTDGLGKRGTDDLRGVGFAVVGAAEDRGTGATTTTVRYGPSRADSAKTLAAAIPGAALEPDPALGGTLEVVLGSNYSGARAVTVTGPAAPKPTASPKVLTAATDPCAT